MGHIGEIAQLLTAIVLALNYIQSWRNGRALKDVKEQTDGINSKLVRVTGEAEHAKGMIQGAREQRDGDAAPR
jgi:hypothetical protein